MVTHHPPDAHKPFWAFIVLGLRRCQKLDVLAYQIARKWDRTLGHHPGPARHLIKILSNENAIKISMTIHNLDAQLPELGISPGLEVARPFLLVVPESSSRNSSSLPVQARWPGPHTALQNPSLMCSACPRSPWFNSSIVSWDAFLISERHSKVQSE